ncbi:diphosphomevalonate decarboxylase-like isoform X2 [Ornithodoros turicata]
MEISKLSNELYMTTTRAPVNIAVVKYWGKANEDLILPLNDSLSLTLSTDDLCAQTTIAVGKHFTEDRIWLNGREESVKFPRIQNCLNEIRRRSKEAREQRKADLEPDYTDWHVHISSVNNFPTAAGMASSAAGYACLVHCLGTLFQVEGDLSGIARRGSGSACRSMYGGFVRWVKGEREDGHDSVAQQVAPVDHWPELRVLILVANDQKKDTGSTSGMGSSVQTSTLLKYRASTVVPQRIKDMTEAILNKDFNKFADVTMQESNQLHAICLDTYPPIRYMNRISWDIVSLVHRYNDFYKANRVAYSFDAGPNAFLFTLEEYLPEVLSVVRRSFPSTLEGIKGSLWRGAPGPTKPLPHKLQDHLKIVPQVDVLKYAFVTKIGDGPQTVSDFRQHLLDIRGMPK